MLLGACRASSSLVRPTNRPLGGLVTRYLSASTDTAATGGPTEPPTDTRRPEDIPLEELEKPKPPRDSLVGKVVSDAMHKSIIVKVERLKLFTPLMVRKKTFKKIMAHDEENTCRIGDLVRIKPSRPLSKMKRFALHEIIKRDPKLSDFQ